jgi:hypothetical protein
MVKHDVPYEKDEDRSTDRAALIAAFFVVLIGAGFMVAYELHVHGHLWK